MSQKPVNAAPFAAEAETEAEQKFKRRIVAVTVGAVLLLSFLLILMVYQLIKISVERGRVAALEAAIAEYNQMIAEDEETIELRRQREWIVTRARELGYVFENDVTP